MRIPTTGTDDRNVDADGRPMEALIRKALVEEGLDDGGLVERIAEKIARGGVAGRPKGLKRYETT